MSEDDFSIEEELNLLLERENIEPNDVPRYGYASSETWLEVLRRFPELGMWVAHNKSIPVAVLDFLSQSEDWQVRVTVAGKRKLSLELFERLALDPIGAVRAAVAINQKTPRAVLEKLLTDPEIHVRKDVLYNRKVPDDLVAMLLNDPDDEVRSAAQHRLARQRASN